MCRKTVWIKWKQTLWYIKSYVWNNFFRRFSIRNLGPLGTNFEVQNRDSSLFSRIHRNFTSYLRFQIKKLPFTPREPSYTLLSSHAFSISAPRFHPNETETPVNASAFSLYHWRVFQVSICSEYINLEGSTLKNWLFWTVKRCVFSFWKVLRHKFKFRYVPVFSACRVEQNAFVFIDAPKMRATRHRIFTGKG